MNTDFNLSQKLGAVQAKPRLIRSILRPMGQATTGVCRVAALVLCAGLGVALTGAGGTAFIVARMTTQRLTTDQG